MIFTYESCNAQRIGTNFPYLFYTNGSFNNLATVEGLCSYNVLLVIDLSYLLIKLFSCAVASIQTHYLEINVLEFFMNVQ